MCKVSRKNITFYFDLFSFFLQRVLSRMKIDILHSSLLVNMKKDGSRRSSVEARMARKRASEKLRIGRFTFGHSFISVFNFTFISLCMLPLIGCDSQQAGITGVDRGRNIPLDAKKAEVLRCWIANLKIHRRISSWVRYIRLKGSHRRRSITIMLR